MLVALLLLPMSVVSAEAIHEDWVKLDAEFIKSLKIAYNKNPQAVADVLVPDLKEKIDLGFAYSLAEGSNGKGYVSTFYQIVFEHDKVVSYRLQQQLPTDKRLLARYKIMYEGLFDINQDRVEVKYLNDQYMRQPLPGFTRRIKTFEKFDDYMSPYSGVVYGDRGGYANSLLKNREHYQQIRHQLLPEHYELLLYSKNPASRLTAIEYFAQRKHRKRRITKRIDEVYGALPQVQTMSGCMRHLAPVEELVRKLSASDIRE